MAAGRYGRGIINECAPESEDGRLLQNKGCPDRAGQEITIIISYGTMRKIKKIWIAKYADRIKGSPDMPTGHRTNFSERSQKNMADFMSYIADYTGDPDIVHFLNMNEKLFDAPALVYLTLGKDHTGWPIYDLGAFGMTLMLAAKDHGVDSIPAYEIVKFPAELRPLLSVSDDEEIIMGIALGYASEDNLNGLASTRLPLEKILTIKQ